MERQALADRQALISRGVGEDLPTSFSEQQRFDEWLEAESQERAPLTGTDLAEMELRMALGVA